MYQIFSVFKTIFLFILMSNAIAYGSDSSNGNLLSINSDKLVINQDKQQAVFTGEVLIWFDDMVLKTSYLEILYKVYNQKKTISEIRIPVKLIARRTISQELLIADSAEYIVDKQELTLLGNVIIQNNHGIIKTNKLVYYTKLANLNLK